MPVLAKAVPSGTLVSSLVERGVVDAVALAFPVQGRTPEQVLVLCSGSALDARTLGSAQPLPEGQAWRPWGKDAIVLGDARMIAALEGVQPRARPRPKANTPRARIWAAAAPGEHAASLVFDGFTAGGATLDLGDRPCVRLLIHTVPDVMGMTRATAPGLVTSMRKQLEDVPEVHVELESADEHVIKIRVTSEALELAALIDAALGPLVGRPSRWSERARSAAEIEAQQADEAAHARERELERSVRGATDELDRLYEMGELETERGNHEVALALYLTFFRQSRGVERWEGVRRSFLLGRIDDLWEKHRCQAAKGAVERLIADHEDACVRGRATLEDLIEWEELIQHAYRTGFTKRKLRLVDRVMQLDSTPEAREVQSQVQYFLHAELLRAERYQDLYLWAADTINALDDEDPPDADALRQAHRAFQVFVQLKDARDVGASFLAILERSPAAERHKRAATLVSTVVDKGTPEAIEVCLEVARDNLPAAQFQKLATKAKPAP